MIERPASTTPDPASHLDPRRDEPAPGASYPRGLRTARNHWWKGVLAILALVGAYLTLSVILGTAAIAVDLATGRTTAALLGRGRISVTPLVFLANNLSLAALLPIAMLLQWGFWGLRPRWLSSVQGRFRWPWFRRAALIVVPLWVVYVAATFVVYPQSLTWGRFTADAVVLTVVVLLTTPLQAAGEEYGARGLINRAAASWSGNPRIAVALGVVISSVVFMIAHGAGSGWLNLYYLTFGACLAIIAWRTGGLEVPVLIHATNNLLAVLPVAWFGDLNTVFSRQSGAGGPYVLVSAAMAVVSVGVVEWWVRRTARRQLAATPVRSETVSSSRSARIEP